MILLFTTVFICSIQLSFAQQRTITGKVTSIDDKAGLPGVSVKVKGGTEGTVTDASGVYKLSVSSNATALIFSYVGMTSKEVPLGSSNTLDVVLEGNAQTLQDVVVTALGITREKKSLGYSTQEVKGDAISTVKTDNFMNALSGKVSGVQIKKTTNMGGSTNILLRGSKSLTGDNQVLFVIDGVPVSNNITNTSSQKQAGLGYDYGNAASDINPDDIESVNVLKGSAATALYGSRAAGGVVMITTKKGAKSTAGTAKKGIGITINSGVNVGWVDKSTFPTYQQQYGAGYGHYYDGTGGYWYLRDLNGDGVDEQCVVTSEDASYGAPFNPNLNVYQWDAIDPESPNYLKATPWVAAKNGPITFFRKPVTLTNTVAIENAADFGSYRLSYTNYNQKGMLPNSELKKDNILLNGTWKVNTKLTATGTANYVATKGLGRNSTGYSDNIMTSFRQWMQTNVDVQQQWDMYDLTKRNVTWNYADPTVAEPIFWDNYYWTRYENYESDNRNRFIGNVALNYKVNDWLDVYGRMSGDSYNELQEERRAVGSIAAPFGIGTSTDGSGGRSDQKSGYLRRDISFSEYNYDLMINFNKNLTEDFNLKGVIGSNTRRTNYNRLISSTSGGLVVPGLYSLQNSVDANPFPKELASKIGVNGIYASASLGYKNYLYLDATMRRDHSSTLPKGSNSYVYPSIASSFIFTNLMEKSDLISFGKVRLNYAVVGNSAGFDQLADIYNIGTSFNGAVTSVPATKKNPDLKPEKTNSLEGGLEMSFFGRKLGFDIAAYKTNTTNQILPLTLSSSTGYYSKMINAGEIRNSGMEIGLNFTPVQLKDLKWTVNVNWAFNKNKVLSLYEGVDNLQLGSFQGGVTINAMVGQPYGVIYGTDYTYFWDADGQPHKIINPSNGRYVMTTNSDNVIGNMNPDWNGGVQNTITYKNLTFSFLIDCQKGGDIFSLDMYYGLATGLYQETAFTNEMGNAVRDPLAYVDPADHTSGMADNSGGFINEGVYAPGTYAGHTYVGGEVNTTPVAASNYGTFGYARLPNKAFIYDASYIKLREISLSYVLPAKMMEKCFFTGATFSLVGSNVWTLLKNIPYADPESGLGAGNLQGYSVGSLPSTRDFGFNVKLNF